MPQDDKPRTVAKSRDYTKAKKVTSIPEGYVKEVGPDGKEYFVKESSKPGAPTPPKIYPITPKPKSATTGTVINPKPTRKPGTETLPKKYEDILYVEPPVEIPPVPSNIPLELGKNINRTLDYNSNPNYYTETYPDVNAGYSKATTKYFDKATKKELDPVTIEDYTKTMQYAPKFIGDVTSNDTINLGTVKPNVSTVTDVPLDINTIKKVPIKAGTLQKGQGGYGTGSVGFAHGGKVTKAPCMNKGGKVKGYVTGGWVDENGQAVTEIPEGYSDKQLSALGWKQTGATQGSGISGQQGANLAMAAGTGILSGLGAKQQEKQVGSGNPYGTTNAMVASTAPAVANAVVPGLGTAVGLGLNAKDAAINNLSETNETTGAYKNKNKAYGAGLINAAYRAQPLGQIDTLLDKDKSAKEKALSIGTFGVYDALKIKKTIDDTEKENMGKVSAEQTKIKSDAAISEAMRKRNAGEFAGGGLIKGKGTGTSDSINATVKANSFVVPAEVSKLILKHAPSLRKKANLNQKGGEKVKLSNGEVLLDPKQAAIMDAKMKSEGINALAPDAELGNEYEGGGRVKGESQTQYVARMKKESANKPATKTTTKVKTAPKTGKTKFEPTIDVNEETIVPGQITDTNYLGNPTKSELNKEVYNITDSTIGTTGATDTPVNTSSGVKTGGKEILDIGTAINYGLPLVQAGIGIKNLLNAGKRPVDKIDPAYNASVERAIGDSRFGFSAEEKFALDQQNQGLTNSQRYNARNLSGGSAANALANERAAINSSYGRGLETTIRGKEIQQEKKRYADAMVADRQEKSRRLFGDTMNAWQQNQSSNAGLVNSGISNLIGASRYNSELEAQKNINSARTSYLNSF